MDRDGRIRQPADPGRSTSEAALNEIKREVARRNEDAHKAARKLRVKREQKQLAKRREWDQR